MLIKSQATVKEQIPNQEDYDSFGLYLQSWKLVKLQMVTQSEERYNNLIFIAQKFYMFLILGRERCEGFFLQSVFHHWYFIKCKPFVTVSLFSVCTEMMFVSKGAACYSKVMCAMLIVSSLCR